MVSCRFSLQPIQLFNVIHGDAKEGLEDPTLAPLSTQPKAMPSVALKAIVYKFRYAQTLEPWTTNGDTNGIIGMWKTGKGKAKIYQW